MKYSDIHSGPVIDLTCFSQEPLAENEMLIPIIICPLSFCSGFHNQRTKENNNEYANSETEC